IGGSSLPRSFGSLVAERPDANGEIVAAGDIGFVALVPPSAPGDGLPTVGCEFHGPNEAALSEKLDLPSRGHIPAAHRTIVAARQDAASVRRYVHTSDATGMSLEAPYEFAAIDIPQLNYTLAGSANGLAIVWHPGQALHPSGGFLELAQLFTCVHS